MAMSINGFYRGVQPELNTISATGTKKGLPKWVPPDVAKGTIPTMGWGQGSKDQRINCQSTHQWGHILCPNVFIRCLELLYMCLCYSGISSTVDVQLLGTMAKQVEDIKKVLDHQSEVQREFEKLMFSKQMQLKMSNWPLANADCCGLCSQVLVNWITTCNANKIKNWNAVLWSITSCLWLKKILRKHCSSNYVLI